MVVKEGRTFWTRMAVMSASQIRPTDLTKICSTVLRSNVERLTTLSTSALTSADQRGAREPDGRKGMNHRTVSAQQRRVRTTSCATA